MSDAVLKYSIEEQERHHIWHGLMPDHLPCTGHSSAHCGLVFLVIHVFELFEIPLQGAIRSFELETEVVTSEYQARICRAVFRRYAVWLSYRCRQNPADLPNAERMLAEHFGKPGLFGTSSEEKTDLSLGYGTFHQLYRIDGVLMAGACVTFFVCNRRKWTSGRPQ